MWSFSVSAEDQLKINTWLMTIIYPAIVDLQKKDPLFSGYIIKCEDGTELPYTGACGGDVTYQFTPTSLGIVFKAVHTSGASIDLTNYNEW
jgi:hypothetical protein